MSSFGMLSFNSLTTDEIAVLSLLCEKGIVTSDQKKIVLTEHQATGFPLEKLILDWGLISEYDLTQYFAQVRNVAYFSIKECPQTKFAWEQLSVEVAIECQALPISYKDGCLTIAMADITDLRSQDIIRCYLKNSLDLKLVMGVRSEIALILQKFEKSVDLHSLFSGQHRMDDQIMSHFLHEMIRQALKQNVSDIHFEPEKFSVKVRYRCDGLLDTVCCFHKSFWNPVCVQIKVLSSMDIAETRRSQDGRFSISISGYSVDVRVACHPTQHGENIVLRILDKNRDLKTLEDLGYTQDDLDNIRHLLQKPEGLFIITGPTGAGKTTSLYAMMRKIDVERLNVMTLEEPIEYTIPGVRQTEVKEQGNMTFPKGVHSILRQDPDVILIGEIRNAETASMAVRSAMTGHNVLTTVHATRSLNAFYRLVELGVPLTLMSGLINGIISQRLVRVLCPFCKRVAQEVPSGCPEALMGGPIYEPTGCGDCFFRGYRGRQVVAEVLMMDAVIEAMILEQAPYSDVRKHLYEQGFKDLRLKALDLVARGVTSWSECQRVMGF